MNLPNEQTELEKQLDESGICFLHAPKFHPAMRFVGPIRKELGVENLLQYVGSIGQSCIT